MRFLNLTLNPPKETTLADDIIKSLIKAGTGRDLIFTDTRQSNYNSLFKLVRFPNPVGFAIVANQDIHAGTLLCPYGGKAVNSHDCDVDISYRIKSTSMYGGTIAQDAKESGDLGSLFVHLPTSEFLNTIGLNETQMAGVQCANTEVIFARLPEGAMALYLHATEKIPAGSILGFDYGLPYWAEMKISPILFKKGHHQIIPAKDLTFKNPPVAICTEKGTPRLLDITTMKQEALLLTFLMGIKNEFSVPGKEFIYFLTRTVHLILTKKEFNLITTQQEAGAEYFLFFRTIQPATCAPPIGFKIADNKTVVPKLN